MACRRLISSEDGISIRVPASCLSCYSLPELTLDPPLKGHSFLQGDQVERRASFPRQIMLSRCLQGGTLCSIVRRLVLAFFG